MRLRCAYCEENKKFVLLYTWFFEDNGKQDGEPELLCQSCVELITDVHATGYKKEAVTLRVSSQVSVIGGANADTACAADV